MVQNNNATVTQGFEILRPTILEFVYQELRAKSGERWWEVNVWRILRPEQSMNLPDIYTLDEERCKKSLDISLLLQLIDYNWNDVFRYKMTRDQRNWLKELIGVRNNWAHATGDGFSDADTWRALDTMARLIDTIDAEAAQKLRDLHRKAQYGGSGISTEAAVPPSAPASAINVGPRMVYPWRAVVTPHDDVARGQYRLAEFAANLAQVLKGTAAPEYQDPVDFFSRTYLTQGLKSLLVNAVQRISRTGGEPVIQLKTAFGGGKTHSMLALYHLARNASRADRLPGVSELLHSAGVSRLNEARVAVLVGTALNPAVSRRPYKFPGITINTLWGEMTAQLAEQLNDQKLYDLIKEADKRGVNPGSDTLTEILDKAGPCVILLDEFVVYARNVYGKTDLPAGTFDSLLSFVQSLTEAVQRSKNSVLLASLPESEAELGGEAGKIALERLEPIFERINSIWRAAGQDEGYEIVRRRLFKDISYPDRMEDTVDAFAQFYRQNQEDFPVDCGEVTYKERMRSCYPIHPEVFDRLYEDWATLESFQRTRGVLRFMATVIYELWRSGSNDYLIMPGSINFGSPNVSEELLKYLPQGWGSIVDSEIDGSRSISISIDSGSPKFGGMQAARRVSRAIFLGSAPDERGQRTRGLEEPKVLLGVSQITDNPVIFRDVLTRMQEMMSYLYSSNHRYWFDSRPTLQKMMRDRALHVERDAALLALEHLLQDVYRRDRGEFSGVHPCPQSSAEVPDEMAVRLVILKPSQTFESLRQDCAARVTVREYLDSRGGSPRIYKNMLVFVAPDHNLLPHAVESMKQQLAWQFILDQREALNLDAGQEREARTSLERCKANIDTQLKEAYSWLLTPTQTGTQPIQWDELHVTGNENIVLKVSRKMKSDELLITQWSPYVLKIKLDELLWRDKDHIAIKELWDCLCRYCYMPRLRDEGVLRAAIDLGLTGGEYFSYADGVKEDGTYSGLVLLRTGLGSINIVYGILVKPEAARKQLERLRPASIPGTSGTGQMDGDTGSTREIGDPVIPVPVPPRKVHHVYASAVLDADRVGSSAGKIAEEVLYHLTSLPGARVTATLQIEAEVPQGMPEDVLRTVRENGGTLRMDLHFDEE